MYEEIVSGLTSFIGKSPTAFHAVANLGTLLHEQGYQRLNEGEKWEICPGQKYYVTRNDSSIIALNVGKELKDYCFKIAASHSDSPAFKVKENAEIQVKEKYMKLNTEGYGGMLCATWFDRPLSVAGRVIVRDGSKFAARLLCVDRDLLLIPNMAIHMNREVNDGYAYNKQVDMLPLFGGSECAKGDFKKLIAKELGVEEEAVYGMDLYLYNRMQPCVWGANKEYISCPQLDDLECAYTSLQGFLQGADEHAVNVFACFDNEEVGSGTKQGAASTFLYDTLMRVNRSLGKDEEEFYRAAAKGFMLSCDNAHAVHPNHPEKTDEGNCVYMNEGIVVKSHAGQKYTSDAVSIAVFRGICEKAGVPLQFFANRSDMAGGSTLGNIAMSQVSMNSIDIGLPQLAMHSAYETAGVKDGCYMIQAVKEFFDSHIETIEVL
ncbi:MAG: M18 family aminopeptidase [Coprococcus sp.]|nr:M18 family aminopeptidase [Coprococcus sp.]